MTKTRLQSREQGRELAEICPTLDPNQVTFCAQKDIFHVWVAVIRYRYMVDLPSNYGYTCTWQDWTRPNSKSDITPLPVDSVKYNDNKIDVRALPPTVDQTTVRLLHCKRNGENKQALVLTLYYTNCNVLVQGGGVRDWAKLDFERLQTVVLLLADHHLSKQEVKTAWNGAQQALTLLPCCDDDNTHDDVSVSANGRNSTTQPAVEEATSAEQQDDGAETDRPTDVASATALSTAPISEVIIETSDPNLSSLADDNNLTHQTPIVERDETHAQVACPTVIGTPSPPPTPTATNGTSLDAATTTFPVLSESPAHENSAIMQVPDAEAVARADDGGEQIDANAEQKEMPSNDTDGQQIEGTHLDSAVQTDSIDTNTIITTLQAQLLKLSEDFDDYKVQAQRRQLVINQERDRAVQALELTVFQQREQLVTLQRQYQSLEQKVTHIKATTAKRSCTARDSASSQTQTPIPVVVGNGSYALGSDNPSPVIPAPNSNPSNPSQPTPPITQHPVPTHPPSSRDRPLGSTTERSSQAAGENTADFTPVRATQPLKLPPSATTLIIGDSNMKNVNPKRLRRGGEVQVRTLRGAKVADVTETFSKLDNATTISKVVLHVGTNNVAAVEARSALLDSFIDEYRALMNCAKGKMPDAQIAVSAIPPQKPWKRIGTVRKINQRLAELCKSNGTTFLPHNAVWSADNEGRFDPSLLQDKVHFTPRGLGLYLREVKAFLFGKEKSVKTKAKTNGGTGGSVLHNHPSRNYADAVSHADRTESKKGKAPSMISDMSRDCNDKHAVRSSEQELNHSSVETDRASNHKQTSALQFPPFNL